MNSCLDSIPGGGGGIVWFTSHMRLSQTSDAALIQIKICMKYGKLKLVNVQKLFSFISFLLLKYLNSVFQQLKKLKYYIDFIKQFCKENL